MHKTAVMPDQLTLKIIWRRWNLFNKNTQTKFQTWTTNNVLV